MYDFFFKMEKVDSYLLKIPKGLRYGVTLFSLLLMLFLWFFFIYKPIHTSLQKHTLLHRHQRAPLIQSSKKVRRSYKKLYNYYRQSYDVTLINNSLQTLSKYNQLEQKNYTTTTMNHNWYNEHVWHINCEGTFLNLQNFLDQLDILNIPLHVKNMRFTKINTHTRALDATIIFYELKRTSYDVA